MKKRIAGIALTAVMALGGMSAFATDGAEVKENTQTQEAVQTQEATQARDGQGAQNGNGKRQGNMDGANRQNRVQSVVDGLKSAGKAEIAEKLQNGEFNNMREAIESLSEEENLQVRETMRELKLNGNGNASGNGMAKQDGSMGLCDK